MIKIGMPVCESLGGAVDSMASAGPTDNQVLNVMGAMGRTPEVLTNSPSETTLGAQSSDFTPFLKPPELS